MSAKKNMKAYILNLPEDTERRAIAESEIRKTPFECHEFIAGVNGHKMTTKERADVFDYEKYGLTHIGACSPGEVGCMLAHRKAWEKIADSNDRMAFIFEDDIRIDNTPWDDIIDFAREWLDCDKPRCLVLPNYVNYLRSYKYETIRIINPIKAFGGQCYALNNAGARHQLQLGKPFFVADEWEFFKHHGLEIAAVWPHPITYLSVAESSIGLHNNEICDWKSAMRLVQPGIYAFSYGLCFYEAILYKLGIIKNKTKQKQP